MTKGETTIVGPDGDAFRGCHRKKDFATKRRANRFIRHQAGGLKVSQPYKCRYCDCWHITKPRKS